MSVFFVIMASPLLTALVFATYFSPVVTAFFRGHPRIGRIALLNLCFGWTVIGWAVCMIWAWEHLEH